MRRTSEEYEEKLCLYKKVAERQAQLTLGCADIKLQDLQSGLCGLSDESLQIVGGFLVQVLQEEELVQLECKLEKFQRQGLHENLQYIGKMQLPLGVANVEQEEDWDPLPIPFALQQFYDEINDGVPDKMNQHKYKRFQTFEEKFDAMPYEYALQLYEEMRKIHICQRVVTAGLAPSKQKSEQEILVQNTKTNQIASELDKFAKQAKTELDSVKVPPGYWFQGEPLVMWNNIKDEVLTELGMLVGDTDNVKKLRNMAIFRNGLKDMQLGVEKIREKYGGQDMKQTLEFKDESVADLQLQLGLCYKGDDIEFISSYCNENGNRRYCPMTLHKVDADNMKAVGTYKYGDLKGQQSEPLDFAFFRPAYLYTPELAYLWEQYPPGTRVDVWVTSDDKVEGVAYEWVEGFVAEQDISQMQVTVELPNYEDYKKGTKITIQNLKNIRISMDFNIDTWEMRSVKSIAREIAQLNQEQWWKFTFGMEAMDLSYKALYEGKEKSEKILQEWCTRADQLLPK